MKHLLSPKIQFFSNLKIKKVLLFSMILLLLQQETKPLSYKTASLNASAITIGLTTYYIARQNKPETLRRITIAPQKPAVLDNEIKIYKTLQQKDPSTNHLWAIDHFWKNIYNQAESTNCGYHALKNAILLLKQTNSFQKNALSVEYYQKTARPWIEEIQQKNIEQNSPNPLGNMITGSDIDHLINTFAPDLRSKITVIDSFEIFDDPTKSSYQEIALLQNLSEQESFNHVFIVNTDALKKARLGNGFHWTVYFLQKSSNSNSSISYMDSLTTINPAIAKKIKGLCLTQEEFKKKLIDFQEAIYVAPTLSQIETLKNSSSDNDLYYYQKYAMIDASLGLLDYADLHLTDSLNLSISEKKEIEQQFEENLPTTIRNLRSTRNVMIDGVFHKELTKNRQLEILREAPKKLRIFTLWKQNKHKGKWHIEIDSIEKESDCVAYVRQCQEQRGTKQPGDRDLRRSTCHKADSNRIEQIFPLIDQVEQYQWSLSTCKKIMNTCSFLTNHGICNGKTEIYRSKIDNYLTKTQQMISLATKGNSDLYEMHTILKNWNGRENPLVLKMSKQIEQLRPE